MALRTLRPALAIVDIKTVAYQPKRADPYYLSPEWRALRGVVLRRDRYSCVLCGDRATIVDHIKGRRFGGGEDTAENCRSLCRTCDNRFKETASGLRKGTGRR